MFGFTRKVDYALIALTALALEEQATGEALSARQIAERYQLPGAMLMNVLKHMNKTGIIAATRGSRGGYRLSRRPDQMLLIDILEAVEGQLRVTPCCHSTTNGKTQPEHPDDSHKEDKCGVMPRCPIMQPMKRLHQRIISMLSDTTLADLITVPDTRTAATSGAAKPTGMPLSQLH